MDDLRTLIKSLQMLAAQPEAEELGLIKAGELITKHIH